MTTILKFGGSSVAQAEGMRNVANIILNRPSNERMIIVVSALRGITDQLIETVYLAEQQNEKYKDVYLQIVTRHRQLIADLFSDEEAANAILKIVNGLLHEIHQLLYSIKRLHDNNLNIIDLVNSFGEQLSAVIFSAFLNTFTSSRYVDARQIILTDNQFTQANIIYDESAALTQQFFETFYKEAGESTIPVVTGFIAKTKDNHTTTIGRDGSNYTAAFLAAALSAQTLEIWSDVDGIYSADPKLINNRHVVPYLDYMEAKELSRLNVKIIRQAIIPQLQEKNIPVWIKNSFKPDSPGTHISFRTQREAIKNISIEHAFHLITLTIPLSIDLNVTKITERLFRCFNKTPIHFSFITQPHASNDISFLIAENEVSKVQQLLDIEFIYEFQNKLLSQKKSSNQSVIALVGREIRQTSSLFGKILIALEEKHLKLSGILYGTSGCNISLILNSHLSKQALTVIHQAVFKTEKEREPTI